MRKMMDDMGEQCDLTGVAVKPTEVDGVPGEWVLADGADTDCRVLYLHGGAFTMGSPLSHRAITAKFSRMIGASILAIDYRLMPENKRLVGVSDCQTAYRWVLENGPDGPGSAKSIVVAGDSAGGNITLTISAWARDAGLRPADAVVALSPATDGTLSGKSIRNNIATDYMLGAFFGAFAKILSGIRLWMGWSSNRVPPSDPRVSPLHGDLSDLPPTLLHVSTAEMLHDEAVRYVNKASEAGSNATLERWDHMLHVWHVFVGNLPEANDAFDRIELFLKHHLKKEQDMGATQVMKTSPLVQQ